MEKAPASMLMPEQMRDSSAAVFFSAGQSQRAVLISSGQPCEHTRKCVSDIHVVCAYIGQPCIQTRECVSECVYVHTLCVYVKTLHVLVCAYTAYTWYVHTLHVHSMCIHCCDARNMHSAMLSNSG